MWRRQLGAGARLRTRMKVEAVLSDGGRVTGVRGSGPSGPFEVEAERVVLSAGGIGTAVIMQASGFSDAGQRLLHRPAATDHGHLARAGIVARHPHDLRHHGPADEGIIMTDVIDPWPLYLFGLVMGGPRSPRYFLALSADAQHHDQGPGSADRQHLGRRHRLQALRCQGAGHAAPWLADRHQHPAPGRLRPVHHPAGPPRGAHPGGTVRIDDMLDRDLQTSVAGLYVCDASVIPEPCGWPPVLTIIALAKRLVNEQFAAARPARPPRPRRSIAAIAAGRARSRRRRPAEAEEA